jgi:apolipoprotein N-acyltransferase
MTALRAAESRLWVVRAANSGVSAIIDPVGRIRVQSEIFVRDVLTHDVPLAPPDRRETFYVRAGDWFAYACWVGVGLLLIRSVGRERECEDDPGGFGERSALEE